MSEYTPEYEKEIESAMQIAERIAGAIQKKLGRYEVSVRRHDTSEVCFVEFRMHVPGSAENQDICSAYSVKYLNVPPEQVKDRAQKILDNVRRIVKA